eukprot:SAG11_NODE_805_length_7090_cov_11.551995_4_plen_442_part_00
MEPQAENQQRPSTVSSRLVEFQAVILAGGAGGARLLPLVDGMAKALLPVENKPLIFHQLRLLKEAGVMDVVIVTSAEAKRTIAEVVASSIFQADMVIKVEACEGDDWGTADALRQVKDSITNDCILLTCDLLMGISLDGVLDAHRIHQGALTVQMVKQPEGAKLKNFVMVDDASDAVLMIKSKEDVHDSIDVRRSIFNKYPSFTIRNDLDDCHLYIMSRWVLDVLDMKPDMRSIRTDLIPYLLKRQYSISQADSDNSFSAAASENKQGLAMQISSRLPAWAPGPKGVASNLHCHVFVPEIPTDCRCLRIQKVPEYHEANRMAAKAHIADAGEAAKLREFERGVVGSETVIAADLKVGSRTSIKKSTVGSGCVLGDDVKIVNCVVMDGATIGNGCSLSGVIICPGATVEEGCDLKDATKEEPACVKSGSRVAQGTKAKGGSF